MISKSKSKKNEFDKILFALITYSCNLSCPHCVAPKKSGNMKIKLFERLLTNYSKNIKSVALSGGEPCLSPYFNEMCLLVKNYNLRLILNTNGEIFNPKYENILTECKPDIFLSLDVPLGTSSTLRYENIYIHNGFNHIRKLITSLTIIITVYRSNLTFLPIILNWALKNFINIKIQPIYLAENNFLYQKESLWNVERKVWNNVIKEVEKIDTTTSDILSAWFLIYSEHKAIPLPKTCLNINKFIIINPFGKRIKCFPSFVKNTKSNFPYCFSEECLFCWEHKNLAESIKINTSSNMNLPSET